MSEIHRKPITRQVDLNLLELFDTVYRTRNLTSAGTVLGLSQPAMSHALARLRDMYKDPLFVRLPRGLQPTPFADDLAAQVATALQMIRGTLEKVSFDPASVQRTFRIAMTDIGEQVFLPSIVKFLESHARGVKLQTRVTGTSELFGALSSGDLDLAVGFVASPPKGIAQQFLFSDRYVCVVRQSHPLVRSATMSLSEFKQLGHVVADPAGTGHYDSIGRVLNAHGISENIVLRVDHFLSIAPLVASTDLIATVPMNLADTFVESWKLRMIEPPVAFPSFDITQYWHERYDHEPGNRWLRGTFASMFANFSAVPGSPEK
jgi:DNA-binding transcriptional LysR family regulator